jgi:hypothetical protein
LLAGPFELEKLAVCEIGRSRCILPAFSIETAELARGQVVGLVQIAAVPEYVTVGLDLHPERSRPDEELSGTWENAQANTEHGRMAANLDAGDENTQSFFGQLPAFVGLLSALIDFMAQRRDVLVLTARSKEQKADGFDSSVSSRPSEHRSNQLPKRRESQIWLLMNT